MDQAEKTAEPDASTAERASPERSLAPERGGHTVTQPATIRRLQSGLGNAAFARLMTSRRRPALHTHAPALASNSATQTLFREETEEPLEAPPLLQRAVSAAGAPPPPPPAPPNESSPGGTIARDDTAKTGIDKIREINAEKWVDPLDEYALEAEWDMLGAAGAKQYPDDFMTSIGKGMEPNNLKETPFVMDKFRQAVEGLRDEYLEGNLKDVGKEEKSLGIGEDKASPEHAANLTDLVIMAEKARVLDQIAKKYGLIQVGYDEELVAKPDADSPHASELQSVPAHFSPGHPPKHPLKGNEGTGSKPYEEVAANYGKTMGALMAIANKHPSIYLAFKSGQLDNIAGKEGEAPQDPQAAAKTMLANARKAIEDTKNNKMSWEELKPIHSQLLRGEHTAGGIPFGDPWYREIVKDEIGSEENLKTAVDVGIGLAVACAFIFSEIATAGWATVFWAGVGLGIGGANVARKWDNYDDLKTAANAGTSEATELVSGGQVTSAAIDAIIESAFFFIDAAGLAIKGYKGVAALGIKKAGKQAAEKAAEAAALKGLKTMTSEQAGPIVVKSIDQLGVKGVAERSGMSVEELLAKVGADSPAGAKIKAFMDLAANGVETSRLPEALRTAIKGGEVTGQKGTKVALDDLVKQAIDELGFQRTLKEAGGWKSLSSALGPASDAGKRLKAWRDVIYQDLTKYVESLRTAADGDGPLVKETGTLENVTNDLDISFLGPRASENKTSAAQFLGGRTGLGADPAILDKMVYIGLFTDPRRMHLFDSFPQLQEKLAKRTMKFEEQLIWNDEYAKYLLEGRKNPAAREMAEKIAAEMETLGIEKIAGFTPLSDRAVGVLSKEQDRLHAAIEAAAKANNMEEAEKLIEQLSNIQAQINVKEGGGYFSAGGVRKFVTDKEGFPGARAAITASHDLGAAIDQVNKLRKAVSAFESAAMVAPASRDPSALAKAIKEIAKYGERFTSAAEVLGKSGPTGEALNAIADEFSQLLLQARGSTVHTTQELLAKNVEGVIAKTRSAISAYDQSHMAIIQALRERAAIEGIGNLAPDIIKATKARYAWLTFENALLAQMDLAARALGLPLQSLVRDADEEDKPSSSDPSEQKGDFPTPSNKNAAPA